MNTPATISLIESAEAKLGIVFPRDYVEFLLLSNGGEGFVGNNYLIMWEVGNLCSNNEEYEVAVNAPGLLLFGSNGGSEAYAFDRRYQHCNIVRVPFVAMNLEDTIIFSQSFVDFLGRLYSEISL